MRLISGIVLAVLTFLLHLNVTAQEKNVVGYFNAGFEKDEFLLKWEITDAENVSKFVVSKKKSSNEEYVKVCEVPFANFRKKSETDSSVVYSYICNDSPEENGVYYYSLSAMNNSGNEVAPASVIKIGITEVPEFRLKQNNPNPFNPSTVIPYEVLVATNIRISVYSLTGQNVDVLVDGFHTPGVYSVAFNAAKYAELSSGIYFYKLETGYSSDIRKMIFAK
ncbi:MAG: T9SS type A sorting domain-containing protein [Ignavibacteria bacterium]|nr:T9SS type A sorting domain-containing protein [Ignavibacteria bacterium]